MAGSAYLGGRGDWEDDIVLNELEPGRLIAAVVLAAVLGVSFGIITIVFPSIRRIFFGRSSSRFVCDGKEESGDSFLFELTFSSR